MKHGILMLGWFFYFSLWTGSAWLDGQTIPVATKHACNVARNDDIEDWLEQYQAVAVSRCKETK